MAFSTTSSVLQALADIHCQLLSMRCVLHRLSQFLVLVELPDDVLGFGAF